MQRLLHGYAGKLVGRLPKTNMGLTTGTATAGSTDWQVKLVDEDVPVICTIIATAEYCGEVVGALGRSIAKMLDPPFGQQVPLSLLAPLNLYKNFSRVIFLYRPPCSGGTKRLTCRWHSKHGGSTMKTRSNPTQALCKKPVFSWFSWQPAGLPCQQEFWQDAGALFSPGDDMRVQHFTYVGAAGICCSLTGP